MVSKTRLLQKVTPFVSHMRAASHPIRAAILFVIREREEAEIWELSDRLGVSSPLISHHIRMLYVNNWIKKVRLGKRVFYRLDEKTKSFVVTYLSKK